MERKLDAAGLDIRLIETGDALRRSILVAPENRHVLLVSEPWPGSDDELRRVNGFTDIDCLSAALDAYHMSLGGKEAKTVDGWSGDQQFFLSFAQSWCEKMRPEEQANRIKTDPHSPGRFRVIGTLADTPAFAEAFRCKTDGPTCTVW